MHRFFEKVDWQVFSGLVILAVGLLLAWETPVVWPLKILVVFFHELSHGLAALVTGGSIVRIELVAQQGGLCVTMGGSRFVVLSAGYLGSMIFGGVILLVASRTRLDRIASGVLGGLLLLVTLLLIRPWFSFGLVFGLVTSLVLLGMGWFLSEGINDFVLRIIGLTSCLYAVFDIKSDILDQPGLRSDAYMLGELTGLPTQFWGIIWIALAVIGSAVFLLLACKKKAGTATEDKQDEVKVAV